MDGQMNDIEKYLWREVQQLQGKVQVLEAENLLMQHTLEGYRYLLNDALGQVPVEPMTVIDLRPEINPKIKLG